MPSRPQCNHSKQCPHNVIGRGVGGADPWGPIVAMTVVQIAGTCTESQHSMLPTACWKVLQRLWQFRFSARGPSSPGPWEGKKMHQPSDNSPFRYWKWLQWQHFKVITVLHGRLFRSSRHLNLEVRVQSWPYMTVWCSGSNPAKNTSVWRSWLLSRSTVPAIVQFHKLSRSISI